MITIDQIQLLQKKVDSAVAKITLLQQENEKLTEQNNELSKVNSVLTQRLSAFEADQNRIEQGILHALDRLNSMENTVMQQKAAEPVQPVIKNNETITDNSEIIEEEIKPEVDEEPLNIEDTDEEVTLSFDDPAINNTSNQPSAQLDIF